MVSSGRSSKGGVRQGRQGVVGGVGVVGLGLVGQAGHGKFWLGAFWTGGAAQASQGGRGWHGVERPVEARQAWQASVG